MDSLPTGIFWDPREPPPPGVPHYGQPTNLTLNSHGGGRKMRNLHAQGTYAPMVAAAKVEHKRFPSFAVMVPAVRDETSLCLLVPLSVAIDVRIVQDVAKVTTTQLYFNDSDETIEKSGYTFPLPAGCAVSAFSCRFGQSKMLRGHVKPKQEAMEEFAGALKRRVTAGLLNEATPEIFNAMLGNIPANTKARVEISFVMELKRRVPGDIDAKSNTISLTIPTSLAPRYGDAPPDVHLDLASEGVSRGLSLRIHIETCEAVTKVSSPSHEVTVERGSRRRDAQTRTEPTGSFVDAENGASADGNGGPVVVTLTAERTELGRDFVLDIQTELQEGEDSTPKAILEIHPTLENQAAVMLTIPPRFLLSHTADTSCHARGGSDGEVIFLADRSGSMDDKMESLKSAMQFFLKGIPVHRKFNVWCFGSSYMNLWPKSAEYTEKSLQEALTFVERDFKADMGGTELLPAMQAIVASRDKSDRADVIVLTDGEVWRHDETIQFAREARQQSDGMLRLFTLGVGDQVSHSLVQGLATAGGGYSEIVPAHTRDGWEDRVVAMTRAALTDHLDMEIEFQGVAEQDLEGHEHGHMLPRLLRSPTSSQSVSLLQKGRVFLLLSSISNPSSLHSVTVWLSRRNDGPHATSPRFVVPLKGTISKDDTVHTLATKAILNDLSLESLPSDAGIVSTKSLGETLGCRFCTVSRWTSLFLSEECNREQEAKGHPDAPRDIAPVAIGRPMSDQWPFRLLSSNLNKLGTPARSPRAHHSPLTQGCNWPSFIPEDYFIPPPVMTPHGERPSTPDPGYSLRSAYRGPPLPTRRICRTYAVYDKCDIMGQKLFVRGLLSFQQFDGAFSFPGGSSTWEGLEAGLGAHCHGAISKLRRCCCEEEKHAAAEAATSTILGVPTKVAHTLMVVALLEKHFQDCADLWQLMAMKARTWVESEVPEKELRDKLTTTWLALLPNEWEDKPEKPAQLDSESENQTSNLQARMKGDEDPTSTGRHPPAGDAEQPNFPGGDVVSLDHQPAQRADVVEEPKPMSQNVSVSDPREVRASEGKKRKREVAPELAASPRTSTRVEVHTVPVDYT
ncbi:hypothetical protein MAPG_00102 [Magnaporthiopsis poae ATCC 64411]|uniref:von Willebrand domain-containing protein n=1 Tax=Magnaporthiopsis poae (strain ATCC 64411 / 73-15) TaxID=644358 RepID=A0A0C4DK40_MAGP6|nr:hypothetical protein MAPG_00102 [Magnaporthiopsis poae ATCC 64411]